MTRTGIELHPARGDTQIMSHIHEVMNKHHSGLTRYVRLAVAIDATDAEMKDIRRGSVFHSQWLQGSATKVFYVVNPHQERDYVLWGPYISVSLGLTKISFFSIAVGPRNGLPADFDRCSRTERQNTLNFRH